MPQSRSRNNNQKLVPQAAWSLDQMKYEIAQELGIELGPDQTSRANGSVGGEMVKRMVKFAELQLAEQRFQ